MKTPCSQRASWLHQRTIVLMIVMLGLILISFSASADDGAAQAANHYKDFLTLFINTTQNWAQPLRTLATVTFWSLAFFELNLAFWPLALQGATLGEFSWAMVKLILFLGFFYALVLHGAGWMSDIVNSFTQAGAEAGGSPQQVTPVGMLAEGLKAALTILDQTSFFSPLSNIGLELSALIVLICFVVIASIMGLLLLESYITIGVATFFFAFGGCRFTSDYARHTFQGAVNIGAKLFLIQLLAASANPLVEQWVAGYKADNANTLGLIALCGIFALACAMIPSVVNRLLGGAGSGGALGTIMGAAGMAMGAGAAVGAASNLAAAQMGTGAAAGAAGAAVEGSAAASLASAATAAPGGLPGAVASMPGANAASGGSSGASAGPMAAGSNSASPSEGDSPSSGRATAPANGAGHSDAKGPFDSLLKRTQAELAAANDNGSSGGSATGKGKTAEPDGVAHAGEHAARTVANFAGHMAKHVGSANPGHAAASEMNSKADALGGSDKPQLPEPESSLPSVDGGTISGGAKLDPEQPLSGDKPGSDEAAPPAPPSPPSGGGEAA